MEIGIVGMGLRGELYAGVMESHPYAKLKAVCDFDETKLEKSAEKYNVNTYTSLAEMLEKEKLDGLIIATPDNLHKEATLLAAAHKVSVMIEKPFATNSADAEEMNDAILKSGIKCLVGFENRWSLPFVAAKEAINRDEVGNIISMSSRLNDIIYVPTKMLNWSGKSTPAWFLLSHSIDLACWFTGKKVKEVYAVGIKKKLVKIGIDTYDSIQTILTFEDGTHATFTTSWILPDSMPAMVDFKYEIIGESGALYIDTQNQMLQYSGQQYKHLPTLGTRINNEPTGAPSHMLKAFINCIKSDIEPEANSLVGLENSKILEAIHKSIEEKSIISIN